MRKTHLFFVLFLLLPLSVFAEWTNLINNYSRRDYKAGSQNWQIIQLDNHWMYFANKMGILEYNGKDWNLYPLNNNTDTRSLFYSKKEGRIYTGGIHEFGYLEPDASGKMRYHCLWDPSSQVSSAFGNIWNIYEIDNAIYFCEDKAIIKWIDNDFISIKSPDKIDCSCLINNTLHIGTPSGVYILAGGAFYRLQHTEPLIQKKLRSILPFDDNKVMIATAREGLFVWDEDGLQPFHTEVDDFLKENELFSISIHGNQLAIGTVLKGVVLITKEGKLLKHINESHGLQNNTVLSTFFDVNGNLWLGLDNGIDYVALNYPITNLYSTTNFYGAGYTAKLHRGKLYLGTNRGLYVCNWPVPSTPAAPELELIEGTQGQVWGLQVLNNELYLCHDRGLFIVESRSIRDLELQVGVWDLQPMAGDENKFWVSTYNGFCILMKKPDWIFDVHQIPSINSSIINFETDIHDDLFLRNSWNELLRISLDEKYTSVKEEKRYRPSDIPEDYYISKWDDNIVLPSASGFYSYTKERTFVKDANLNQLFETTRRSGAYRSLEQAGDAIWVLGENILGVKYADSGQPEVCYHNLPLITNFERLLPVTDSMVIIPNENGFALWNLTAQSKKPNYPLQIMDVRIVKNPESLEGGEVIMNTGDNVEIPYKNNSLVIRYSLINYSNQSNVQFRTKFDDENWSDYSQVDLKTYSDISIGSHTFQVSTQLDDGSMVENSFSFTILPPWYRTMGAYIVYCILLLFLLFCLWYWDDKRIKKKEHHMKLEQEKVIELKEETFKIETEKKEKEIIHLKNERLEMDIRHKSQELANSAINLGRKNEVLIEIKEELLKLLEDSQDNMELSTLRQKIMKVNNRIDSNIQDDDSLRKFEENFDLVHNNFMDRLISNYPVLTVPERKMCAYIKMQLSSKEIAPLLNISVRGAETLRYRLRKKLELSRDESLTQFLINY